MLHQAPLLISFSGGRTSAMMTHLLLNAEPERIAGFSPVVVFANTGCEHEKTLEFVNQCDKHFGWQVIWLEAKVFHGEKRGSGYIVTDFEHASRHGEPYREVVKKYGLANVAAPHCTRELKRNTIYSFLRDTYGTSKVKKAIGIRADETQRINPLKAKAENLWYPLAEIGIDKQDVDDFWAAQAFDLELPHYLGNCVWCFKKSDTKLLKALAEAPEYFDVPRRLEREFPNTVQGKMGQIFRKNRTVADFEKLLRETDAPHPRLITDAGCSESCEFV